MRSFDTVPLTATRTSAILVQAPEHGLRIRKWRFSHLLAALVVLQHQGYRVVAPPRLERSAERQDESQGVVPRRAARIPPRIVPLRRRRSACHDPARGDPHQRSAYQ